MNQRQPQPLPLPYPVMAFMFAASTVVAAIVISLILGWNPRYLGVEGVVVVGTQVSLFIVYRTNVRAIEAQRQDDDRDRS